MSEIPSRLSGSVRLAKDLKHRRQVALKVFHPDLAATFGTGPSCARSRWPRNFSIQQILPLHDSAEADGFIFYIMLTSKFVAGGRRFYFTGGDLQSDVC